MKRVARLVRRVGRRLLTRTTPPRPAAASTPLAVVEEGEAGVRVEAGLAFVEDVWCAPAFGVVFDKAGQVFASPARAALRFSPDLSSLPAVSRRDGISYCAPPADAPTIPRAAVFADWGALHNYAQFLLAGLPALLAMEERGVLERFPPIAPPLTAWQAELLALAGAPAPVTVEASLARLGHAVFPIAASDEAAAPNPGLKLVRDRLLAAVAPADRRRIYVSRRDTLKAVMVDEAWVEEALEGRGFTIVRPETGSPAELIALFQGAEVVVAPAGTALANVLFCAPGTKIVEIRPPEAPETFVPALARMVGATWFGYQAAGPRQTIEVPLEPRLRPASAFEWRTGEGFLAFVDGVL